MLQAQRQISRAAACRGSVNGVPAMICRGGSSLRHSSASTTWASPSIQQPLSARRGIVAAAGTKVNGEQLEVEIQSRDRPLIVDFYATWCGPCVMLSKELDEVAKKLGDGVKILKVDVDENQQLSSQLRIEGLPTIVFIPQDSSKPALRTEGLLPAAEIINIVKELQAPAQGSPQA